MAVDSKTFGSLHSLLTSDILCIIWKVLHRCLLKASLNTNLIKLNWAKYFTDVEMEMLKLPYRILTSLEPNCFLDLDEMIKADEFSALLHIPLAVIQL